MVFSWVGCGVDKASIDTDSGREALYDEVGKALTKGDCAAAIRLIEPLYQSSYSTNRGRLLRSAAYGCRAGVNLLSIIDELSKSDVSGNNLWKFTARLFPDPAQTKMESSWVATDSLLTVIEPGVTVSTANKISSNAFNTGSINPSDRTGESNTILIFSSLATIGSTQNRYGAPDSSYTQTVDLPWTAAATVDSTGCAFASSVMNLLDAVEQVSASASGSIKTALAGIASLKSGFNTACGGTCSVNLRNRESCTGAAAQTNIDAAVIVNVVNLSW